MIAKSMSKKVHYRVLTAQEDARRNTLMQEEHSSVAEQ
jgi:hypothetical protein